MRIALARVEQGVSLPTFKAIFKTDHYPATISGVLEESLKPKATPTFICIRSEAEAQDWEGQVPGLWQQCNSGRSTWPTETALFLCPAFLRRQSPGGPLFGACPGVAANRFHTVPDKPLLFAGRAFEITRYLLTIQDLLNPPYQTSDDPNVYMNLPLAWHGWQAVTRVLSYLMYIQCGSKTCSHCC